MQQLPQEPRFVKTVTSIQKILAGIAVTMFFAVWFSGIHWFQEIFKPNFVNVLNGTRVVLAVIGLACISVVGYTQLSTVATWIMENYQLYLKLKQIKKDENP
jgi:hypothetical protein